VNKYEVPFYITVWKNGKITRRLRTGNKEIKPIEDEEGFLRVTLSAFGFNMKGTHQYVHRLVAEKYLDNPNNHEYVLFKDGNIKNVHCNNLEWCE
jgi:hypothetical protein